MQSLFVRIAPLGKRITLVCLFVTLQVVLNQETFNDLVPFLVNSITKCKKWALINLLKALASTLYENGAFCGEVSVV